MATRLVYQLLKNSPIDAARPAFKPSFSTWEDDQCSVSFAWKSTGANELYAHYVGVWNVSTPSTTSYGLLLGNARCLLPHGNGSSHSQISHRS